MKHALAVLGLMAASSCSHPSKPPCSEASVTALRLLYERAASEVIGSGACDKVQRIQDCEAYMLVETQFAIASKAMCQ